MGYRVQGRLFLIFLKRKLCASACIFLWLIRAQLTQLTSSGAPYFSCYLNRYTLELIEIHSQISNDSS